MIITVKKRASLRRCKYEVQCVQMPRIEMGSPMNPITSRFQSPTALIVKAKIIIARENRRRKREKMRFRRARVAIWASFAETASSAWAPDEPARVCKPRSCNINPKKRKEKSEIKNKIGGVELGGVR
jgi:hypothetical protein